MLYILLGRKPKTSLRLLMPKAPAEEQVEVLHMLTDILVKNNHKNKSCLV